MVIRGLSTLVCEDWNLRGARKKPAVASSTGSKADTAYRTAESGEYIETHTDNVVIMVIHCIRAYPQSSCHWIRLAWMREWGRRSAQPPHFNQSHAQVITSPSLFHHHLQSQRTHESPVATGKWRTSKCGCIHAAAASHGPTHS